MNLQQDQKADIIIRNMYVQAKKFTDTRFSYHQYEKHNEGAFSREQIFERVEEIVKSLINIHFTCFKFRLELYHNRKKGRQLKKGVTIHTRFFNWKEYIRVVFDDLKNKEDEEFEESHFMTGFSLLIRQ